MELVGTTIGNYKVLSLLGEGGMAEVYLAEHPKIGRRVAIKVISTSVGKGGADRFVEEAKALTRVQHPNVVQIFDFGQLDDGRPYYVMEPLPGAELSEVIADRCPMPPEELLPYIEQICAGLQAVHDQGVVHRDLKPENIFVDHRKQLNVKIIDFGIAKLMDVTSGSKTATGTVMGSPYTIAPEQAAGETRKIGAQADIYSLGVIMYWMLAGRPPFDDGGRAVLLAKHITERPPSLHGLIPALPRALVDVVERCMEKEPSDRPRYPDAVARAFTRALEEAATPQAGGSKYDLRAAAPTPRPPTPRATARRFRGGVATIIALSLVAGFTGWFIATRRSRSTIPPKTVSRAGENAPAKTTQSKPAPPSQQALDRLAKDITTLLARGEIQSARIKLRRAPRHPLHEALLKGLENLVEAAHIRNQANLAMDLYMKGKYEEAEKIATKIASHDIGRNLLNTFRAAKAQKQYLAAITLFNDGKLDEARALFDGLKSFADAKAYVVRIDASKKVKQQADHRCQKKCTGYEKRCQKVCSKKYGFMSENALDCMLNNCSEDDCEKECLAQAGKARAAASKNARSSKWNDLGPVAPALGQQAGRRIAEVAASCQHLVNYDKNAMLKVVFNHTGRMEELEIIAFGSKGAAYKKCMRRVRKIRLPPYSGKLVKLTLPFYANGN